MRSGGDGQEFQTCPCPNPTCYSCQPLGEGAGRICCPNNAAGCRYPGTGAGGGVVAGTGVGISGFGTGGILLPPGADVGRFAGGSIGTGGDIRRIDGGFTRFGPGQLSPSGLPGGVLPGGFVPGGVPGGIPAGMRSAGVVPTDRMLPTGGLVPSGGIIPAGASTGGGFVQPGGVPGVIPAGMRTAGVVPSGRILPTGGISPAGATTGGGFVPSSAVIRSPIMSGPVDSRFRGIMRGPLGFPVRGPMMMGAIGGVCPGRVPSFGSCYLPFGMCPVPQTSCISMGGARGICCPMFRGGFGMSRRFFR